MFVVDMHADSLRTVTEANGLINRYNFSREYPQLQFMADFVPRLGNSPEQRRREVMHYLDVYIAEAQRLGLVRVLNCHDVNFAIELEKRATLFAVEGGGGLFADSEELTTLHKMGLRVLGLAWDSNELATSSRDNSSDKGLTAEGFKMVERCSELGIILDISHLSDRAVYDLLGATAYPVIATHSNFREVRSSERNLPLDIAKKVASRGGVIGINLYPEFLGENIDAIFSHIDYALDKLGEDAIAFGFDIDGTDGKYPVGITEEGSIHDRVIELLLGRYSERLVEKLAGLNAIDFLKNNL